MATELTLLYDADCGICTHTARVLARLDSRGHHLRLVSLQAAGLPGMPARDKLTDALHAVDDEGHWFTGAAAGVEVARRIPLLWPISVVARLPLAMPVLDVLYRAVADNRHAISRLFRLDACRVPGAQS
jgi:predicted DCC family thiol-disulfide oxidoreductase YuxK